MKATTNTLMSTTTKLCAAALVIFCITSGYVSPLEVEAMTANKRGIFQCSEWNKSRPADCPSGFENTFFGTCVKTGDSYSEPSHKAECKDEGFVNTGLTCWKKPESYHLSSRAADCPQGWTNIGALCFQGPFKFKGMSSMTCGYNAATNPDGIKEIRRGARCYKACKEGFTNIGEFCRKRGETKIGKNAYKCLEGEQLKGGRCFKTCKDGYTIRIGDKCKEPTITLGPKAMTCDEETGEFRKHARCYKTCNVDAGYKNFGELCTNWECVKDEFGKIFDKVKDKVKELGNVLWSECGTNGSANGIDSDCADANGDGTTSYLELIQNPKSCINEFGQCASTYLKDKLGEAFAGKCTVEKIGLCEIGGVVDPNSENSCVKVISQCVEDTINNKGGDDNDDDLDQAEDDGEEMIVEEQLADDDEPEFELEDEIIEDINEAQA